MRLAIIPARGGSRRIPGKNARPFHGKPIIAYSIEAAQREARLFDVVVVSTDDPTIKAIALGLNCAVHERSAAMSQNHIGTQAVAADVLRWAITEWGAFDHACVIYATAPMMMNSDLWRGLEQVAHRDREFAFSVGASPLRDAGQFYFGRAQSFLEERPLIAHYTAMIPIDEDRVCDINTPEDWSRAEKMYSRLYMKGCPA